MCVGGWPLAVLAGVNATNEPCSVNHILSSHIVLINARIQVSFKQFKQFQVVDTCLLLCGAD